MHQYFWRKHNYSISIKQLVETILKISKKKVKINYDLSKPEGALRKNPSINQIKSILPSYEFSIPIEDGIKKTFDYCLENKIFC